MAAYIYTPAFLAGEGLNSTTPRTIYTAPSTGAVLKNIVLVNMGTSIFETTVRLEVMANGFPSALAWDMPIKWGTTVSLDIDVPLMSSAYSIRASNNGHPVDVILTGFLLSEV